MDPSPPSASPVEDSSSLPDQMNKLANLTSDCQISSDDRDPLQRAVSQTFGDEFSIDTDQGDDNDGNMDSQLPDGDDTLDSGHAGDGEASFNSSGACGTNDEGYNGTSATLEPGVPPNQDAYSWHANRRHLWLDNNPSAVKRANDI